MKCPQCGEQCERDEVDNGVGMEACSPWGCPFCYWFEKPEAFDFEPAQDGRNASVASRIEPGGDHDPTD